MRAALKHPARADPERRTRPPVRTVCVTIDSPSMSDTASDTARLMRALKQQHGFECSRIDAGSPAGAAGSSAC